LESGGTRITQENALIKKAAEAIFRSRSCVALTGAGISVGSGIPPFRGEGGLWEKYDPEEYANVQSFLEDPEKVWIMLKEMIDTIVVAKPNPAHIALAELDKIGKLDGIITGNVDFLHQAAGSNNVLELHGNNHNLICMKCGKTFPIEKYSEEMPPKCSCGYTLRPEVVLFGEQLPQSVLFDSYTLARNCDVMLVVGTSSMVSPMSHMPYIAKENKATIIEINLQESFFSDMTSDFIIKGKAEDILPKIVSEIKRL
jgi:NAD-dependent deacetylase